eukprot:s2099_g11.t1
MLFNMLFNVLCRTNSSDSNDTSEEDPLHGALGTMGTATVPGSDLINSPGFLEQLTAEDALGAQKVTVDTAACGLEVPMAPLPSLSAMVFCRFGGACQELILDLVRSHFLSFFLGLRR